ncbi:MAG: hypothetical protein J3Q66DRAFT_399401 [Benniella sp.]|nr:MAG: hypothetical protein J3Q66DRAFT_399401 [Benniella sp.]
MASLPATPQTSSSTGSRVSFFLPFSTYSRDQVSAGKDERTQLHNTQKQEELGQQQEPQVYEESPKDQGPPWTGPRQQTRHSLVPSDIPTLDLLTEYRQVEQYIQRLHEAFRTALASESTCRSHNDTRSGTSIWTRSNELFKGIDPSSSRPSTSSCSGGNRHAQCHISPDLFGDDPILIPMPPPSLRLLEYRCEFDGVTIARELVKRRNELWEMVQHMERERERREFEERMLRLRFELEKESVIELRKLDHRHSTS